MKILICTPEYPPKASGIGIVAKSVAEELIRKGHECVICSPTGPDIQFGNQGYIEKFGGAGLLYFWENVRRFFRNDADNYDAIWLHHPLFIFKCPFNKLLITMHTTYYGYSILSKKLKYNYFIRIYYAIIDRIERLALKKLNNERIIFSYIDNQVLNELTKIGINESNTKFISNGVNTIQFKPSNEKIRVRNECKLEIPEEHKIFLSVGRLTGQKRPFELIDVFTILNKQIQNSSLVIVGTGELSNKLHEYVSNLNIDNVHFLGFVEDDLLAKLYSISDYYIMASEYEGQPLTLLEAMASGLPCIVSDIPNLRIVEDTNSGIIVDFSDKEKAACEIINYVSQDKSEHGKNARKHAVDKLDWSIIAEKYLHELNLVSCE